MRGWLIVSVAFAISGALAAGCGGESDGDGVFEEPPGSGGAAGGDVAPGGSSSGGGSSEQSGGRAAGGRATFGGTSGGGTSGGPGRAGGESGGASGSAAAGSSAGGSASVIPADFEKRCKANCSSADAARCPNTPSARECAQQCRITAQRPECVNAVESLFDCAERGTFTCDENGEATVPGCELTAAAATLCVLRNASDPELREPCEEYCAASSQAECPNAESMSDCVSGCQLGGGLLAECAPDWRAYLTCSDEATFYCGDDGKPIAEGCEAEFLRFAACFADDGA